MILRSEELLAGSLLTFELEIPPGVLHPADGAAADGLTAGSVRVRPLTVADLQRVARAASDDDSLLGTLMVQQALVKPELSVVEVAALHVGLVQYLLREVNRISGIDATAAELADAREAPLARAAFVLAQEFGWTPEDVGRLTLGQVLLHLEMLDER